MHDLYLHLRFARGKGGESTRSPETQARTPGNPGPDPRKPRPGPRKPRPGHPETQARIPETQARTPENLGPDPRKPKPGPRKPRPEPPETQARYDFKDIFKHHIRKYIIIICSEECLLMAQIYRKIFHQPSDLADPISELKPIKRGVWVDL